MLRVAVGGDTVTVATGEGVTVTVAVPLLPSLDAVIVTVPALIPFTSPVLDTMAVASSLDVQPTRRPGSVAPDASRTVAVSCVDAPTTTLAVGGVIATVATGTCLTVMTDVPVTPSTLANTTVDPTASPVTRPVADTEATDGAPLVHATVRPPNA